MTLKFHRTKSYDFAIGLYNFWLDMGRQVAMSYEPDDGTYFIRYYL